MDIRGGPAATIGFALHPWARGSAGQVANASIATIAKGDDFSPRTHWLTVAVLRRERILLRPDDHAMTPAADGGLGLRRLELLAAAGNAASAHIARRTGFVEVGRERQAERLGDGSYDDLLTFDLLSGDRVSPAPLG